MLKEDSFINFFITDVRDADDRPGGGNEMDQAQSRLYCQLENRARATNSWKDMLEQGGFFGQHRVRGRSTPSLTTHTIDKIVSKRVQEWPSDAYHRTMERHCYIPVAVVCCIRVVAALCCASCDSVQSFSSLYCRIR